MVIQRSTGIRTLTLICQSAGVSAVLWVGLFFVEGGRVDESTLVRFGLLYNEFILIGVLFGQGRRDIHDSPHAFVVANRQSVRQTLLAAFAVFILLWLVPEAMEFRFLLLGFLPVLYVTLLISNFFLPRRLGRWVFSGTRIERVA